jgi:hypothetical protein
VTIEKNLKRTLVATIASLVTRVATAASTIEYFEEPSGIRERPSNLNRGADWLSKCLSDDTQLFAESRLRRLVFDDLARLLREGGVRDGHALVSEKLLIFLYICGNRSSFRNVKYCCGRSIDTVS